VPVLLDGGGSEEQMNPANHTSTDYDPLIHGYASDSLPDTHPWCERDIYCASCPAMLHARNNECMQAWIEYSGVALCVKCAAPFLKEFFNHWCFLDEEGNPKSMTGKIL
jgi:hypothetical protein